MFFYQGYQAFTTHNFNKTPDYQVSATTMSKSPQVTTVHEKKKKKSEIASGYFSAPLSFK